MQQSHDLWDKIQGEGKKRRPVHTFLFNNKSSNLSALDKGGNTSSRTNGIKQAF